jgi:hypothetical protein
MAERALTLHDHQLAGLHAADDLVVLLVAEAREQRSARPFTSTKTT